MAEDAFYHRRSDGLYHATDATNSPWDARFQHAGPPCALVAHVVDAREPNERMRIGRITLEIFGPIPKADLEVTTRLVRPGKRIELFEVRLAAGGKEAILAHVWRYAYIAERSVPAVDHGGIVAPLPGPQARLGNSGIAANAYFESFEWRLAGGSNTQPGPAAVWSRAKIPTVAGEPSTPRDALLAFADSANGVSLELPPEAWFSIPASVTISLARDPETEWGYLGAKTQIGPDGRGVTTGVLGDERGVVGNIVQALLVTPR
jgi:hypothetical protein